MKKIYTLLALFSLIFGFSQPPAGYYASATGTGFILKTQLYNIIDNHNDRGYPGLYTTYQASDVDSFYENDGSLLDMYSENPNGIDPYVYQINSSAQRCGTYSVEGDCYNREHVIPQYFFNSDSPMLSDAHSVTPTDGKVNGLRNNFPHGKAVATGGSTTLNLSRLAAGINSGYAAGYSGTVFEVLDAFKGDFARIYFYFATRYENLINTWGNTYPMFDGSTDVVFTPTFKNILLQWNLDDPVSPREVTRNNAIYARQNNRNPYIDNNSYVQSIWGLAPSQLNVSDFEANAQLNIYPNPTNDSRININSNVAIDEIEIITINGQILQMIKKPIFENNTYTLDNLNQGFYFLKLTSNNQTLTKKIIVN